LIALVRCGAVGAASHNERLLRRSKVRRSPDNAPVCARAFGVAGRHRPRPFAVWDPLATADEGASYCPQTG